MLKVFRVRPDDNDFQYFLPAHVEDIGAFDGWDCRRLKDTWSPPEVYIKWPFHERGDFFGASWDLFITSPRATEILRGFLEAAGELLPLPYEGETYTVLNVTQCIDCLDEEATTWAYSPDGAFRLWPEIYVFAPERLPRSTVIFKIPQRNKAELYIVEGFRAPEEEFRAVVERNGLRGLVYDLLWEGGS